MARDAEPVPERTRSGRQLPSTRGSSTRACRSSRRPNGCTTAGRSPHRRAGSARASARTGASAQRNGRRRRRDAVRLAQAVRAGKQFRRRQTDCWTASSTCSCSASILPRHPRASDHAVAPAGRTLLRRWAARAPGEPSPRDSRGVRRRVGDVARRCGGGDPRPDRWQDVSHRRAHLRSAARGRNGRGSRGAAVLRRLGECAAGCERARSSVTRSFRASGTCLRSGCTCSNAPAF